VSLFYLDHAERGQSHTTQAKALIPRNSFAPHAYHRHMTLLSYIETAPGDLGAQAIKALLPRI
jgi:hypothetical protein